MRQSVSLADFELKLIANLFHFAYWVSELPEAYRAISSITSDKERLPPRTTSVSRFVTCVARKLRAGKIVGQRLLIQSVQAWLWTVTCASSKWRATLKINELRAKFVTLLPK
jgi:hypothetical protein